MPKASWPAAADGRYWIDVILGSFPLRVMVDTGLVDPLNLVGFELEVTAYDLLKKGGGLSKFLPRRHRDASGRIVSSETGLAIAQLLDPIARLPIGPVVAVYSSRGSARLPNRVGLAFFHRLHQCRVDWDLTGRTWCVDLP